MTAIDMRRLLHRGERERVAEPVNVVIRAQTGTVSLPVEEIGDVLDLEMRHLSRLQRIWTLEPEG